MITSHHKLVCAAAYNYIKDQMKHYSKQEIYLKADQRNIVLNQSNSKIKNELMDHLVRERYVINITNIFMWEASNIKQLANKLHVIREKNMRDTEFILAIVVQLINKKIKGQIQYNVKNNGLITIKNLKI